MLTEIAHFHAVTYHYLQQYPGGLEKLKAEDHSWFINNVYSLTGDEKMREEMLQKHTNVVQQCAKVSTRK